MLRAALPESQPEAPMLLMLHSLLRWLVLFGGLAATALAFQAMRGKPWTKQNKMANLLYLIALDTQFLIGIATWLNSDIVKAARVDMATAMHDATTRFFTVEHPTLILLGLATMHIGYANAKRAGTDLATHRKAFIAFALSLVFIVAAIPWPFLPYGRPLH
jgi:hypothetical protein